jgi:hypothetical protein
MRQTLGAAEAAQGEGQDVNGEITDRGMLPFLFGITCR